ncbi:MAG: DNA glycosylase [Eubacteriales bacterium]
MRIEKQTDRYIVTEIGDFDSDAIFTSGQCFRWIKLDDYWHGISLDKTAKVKTIPNGIELVCNESDVEYWVDFLDLEYDYTGAKKQLMKDADIAPMIDMLPGMRFLNQDFYECLMSFIISANNNIKRITMIIKRISQKYGKHIEGDIYTFPKAEILAGCTTEDMLECGAGYRASYIVESARRIAQGYDFTHLYTDELDVARKELTIFKGVGIKVADCVLLFSLRRKDAFPVDTWIRKVMQSLYSDTSLNDNQIRDIAKNRFGGNAGLANQYLFHINRTGM